MKEVFSFRISSAPSFDSPASTASALARYFQSIPLPLPFWREEGKYRVSGWRRSGKVDKLKRMLKAGGRAQATIKVREAFVE
jgi:hypothetical protein